MDGIPRQPGRLGFAGQCIQDIAAAASVATGRHWPAPSTTPSQRCMMTAPWLPPRTIPPCIHCRQNPAGFGVGHTRDQIARRPWRRSCCQGLAPGRHHVIPFDGHTGTGLWP
jgi:hypothetical protein